MKQKNYDVQQMYKEYMQGVGSDPTAIEDILSGERQPANTGARIKHSTGKAATIAATAAVIAICAGIGFSNMNENDVDSKAAGKPETTLVTTVDQTKTNDVVPPAEQEKKIDGWYISSAYTDSFKLETTSFQADKSLARMTVTLMANDEKGKEIIKKYNKKGDRYAVGGDSIYLGGETPCARPQIVDSTGYHHELDMHWVVVDVAEDKVVFNCDIMLHKAADSDIPFTINAFIPGNKTLTDEEIANGAVSAICIASAKLTYKANTKESEFICANGEKLTVSDIGIISHRNIDVEKAESTANAMRFTFADGTNKTAAQLGQKLTAFGGGCFDGVFSNFVFFSQPIGADKLTSITYDGVEYTPKNDAKISIEKNIDEAKKAYIEATIEKQKLIKKNPNANTKEYDSAMIEAAKYIAQNKGSDILCAGLTSDKHFIAAACFSGNNAQKVKACADKMAQQGIRYNWFILIDKSGNELCKCYIDWCHMISGNAYVQIYSENAVSFAALPDGAVLRCLTDSSFADINVSLTDGDLGTTLFNNIKQ